MEMAKHLQEALNEVYWDNIFEDSKVKKAKAIGAAFLSGAIDGAVIAYIPLVIGSFLAANEIKKLKGE